MSLIHADRTSEKVRRLLSDLFRALPHREKRLLPVL